MSSEQEKGQVPGTSIPSSPVKASAQTNEVQWCDTHGAYWRWEKCPYCNPPQVETLSLPDPAQTHSVTGVAAVFQAAYREARDNPDPKLPDSCHEADAVLRGYRSVLSDLATVYHTGLKEMDLDYLREGLLSHGFVKHSSIAGVIVDRNSGFTVQLGTDMEPGFKPMIVEALFDFLRQRKPRTVREGSETRHGTD